MNHRYVLSLAVSLGLLATVSGVHADWIELKPGATPSPVTPVLIEADEHGAVFELSFTGIEATTVETPLGSFTRVDVPGCGIGGAVGEPELPVCRVHVELPVGATPGLAVVDHETVVSSVESLGIEQRIWPRQAPIPKLPGAAEAAELLLDEQAYGQDALQPEEIVRLGGTGEIRGHRFVEVEVLPLAYAPASGEVS